MRSRPGHVAGSSARSGGADSRSKADQLQPAHEFWTPQGLVIPSDARDLLLGAIGKRSPIFRGGLVVPRNGLKRKRIVRTAEVTIETEENVVLRTTKGRQTSLMWCPACRRQVEMVTPEQAAEIAGVSTRTIYRWVEGGSVHFNEDNGRLWVCVAAFSRPRKK